VKEYYFQNLEPDFISKVLWLEVLAPRLHSWPVACTSPDCDGLFFAGLKPAGMRQANRKRLDRMKVPSATPSITRRAICRNAWCRIFVATHDLSLATPQVHLDDCMEVTALKGPAGEVRHFVDHTIAEPGVRYGRVVMIPTSKG
jgi:hypothetical protein